MEYITEITDNLRASESMLKALLEREKDIVMRTTEEPVFKPQIGVCLALDSITIKPSEPLYEALISAFTKDVRRWKTKLQDALEITEYDPRLSENK